MQGCTGKKSYSKMRVIKVKQAAMKARNRRLRAYECKCGWWHLTSEIGNRN